MQFSRVYKYGSLWAFMTVASFVNCPFYHPTLLITVFITIRHCKILIATKQFGIIASKGNWEREITFKKSSVSANDYLSV